jgi:oligopeptide/dipeptide ABC transporter ATP-binding protein
VSIVFISHGLGLVSELCDDVIVMYAGTVAEAAPTRALFADPQHPYTRALLACEISTQDAGDPRLRSIPGEVPDLVAVPGGCIFFDRCGDRMPTCRLEPPALRPCGENHRAACIFAGAR